MVQSTVACHVQSKQNLATNFFNSLILNFLAIDQTHVQFIVDYDVEMFQHMTNKITELRISLIKLSKHR